MTYLYPNNLLEIKNTYEQFVNNNNDGTELIQTFIFSIFHNNETNIFQDDLKLKTIIENMNEYSYKSLLETMYKLNFCIPKYTVSMLDIKDIIQKFTNKNDNVLDVTASFGEVTLSTISLARHYEGFGKLTYKQIDNMLSFLRIYGDNTLNKLHPREIPIKENHYDLAFINMYHTEFPHEIELSFDILKQSVKSNKYIVLICPEDDSNKTFDKFKNNFNFISKMKPNIFIFENIKSDIEVMPSEP